MKKEVHFFGSISLLVAFILNLIIYGILVYKVYALHEPYGDSILNTFGFNSNYVVLLFISVVCYVLGVLNYFISLFLKGEESEEEEDYYYDDELESPYSTDYMDSFIDE